MPWTARTEFDTGDSERGKRQRVTITSKLSFFAAVAHEAAYGIEHRPPRPTSRHLACARQVEALPSYPLIAFCSSSSVTS